MNALVIDDSRAMRRIIGRMLTELGFQITEAEHGADALERLESLGTVELCLVDWNMPVMNGFEFLKAVRADDRHRDSRIVMVTTETGIDEMTMALEAGADEYVMKPFTKEAMLEKLHLLGF